MTAPFARLAAALADRYRVERELGQGGMATVYLAHDLRHDRKVAIKVLRPELSAILGAERFLAEIKTTANLQHPHILPLHDSGTADGTVFYVMPYIEGERGSNGQEIFYTTGSPGTTLMKRRADGSGAAVRILSDPRLRGDLAVSVDGRTVLMKGEWRPSNFVLVRYRVGEDTAPVPMPSISSFAPTPRLSPDGRWLAYVSGESGRPEIYVRPFPDVEARKVQVSVEGGVAPSWRPTGGELYYVSGNGDLTAATVRTTPTFEVTGRTALFPTSEFQDRDGAAIYSPAPDGKRFLMLDISGSRSTGPGYLGGQLVIVQNLAAELQSGAPR